MSFVDLPKDRLATTDAEGKRIYLYPRDVSGQYHNKKIFIHFALITVFLLLPWITINGEQAFLLDIGAGRFFLFGWDLRSHDVPLVFFFLLLFTLSIAFVTAQWGRLWCGWACPQTVFIEGIFRRVERWIEGNHRERKNIDSSPLNSKKLQKKLLKWMIFFFLSLMATHSFLAYFVGAKNVWSMITRSPTENWTSFIVICVTTSLILFNFGWFREQFCVIACPYGRFQSVLMDSFSLIIGYDARRGDCVDCFKCVQACPTGIDIRRGLQMECIACTACIDTCDEVMEKLHKPKGLISYTTQQQLLGTPHTYLRPRTWIYLILLLMTISSLTLVLSQRQTLSVTVLRARDIPYQEIANKNQTTLVVNHFKIELVNQKSSEQEVSISLRKEHETQGLELFAAEKKWVLAPGQSQRADFFIRFPKSFLHFGHASISMHINSNSQREEKLPLIGPLGEK